ncbi:capsid protein [Faeces associated gemycircularvirus 18]|uniref:Capsid protein n=1 Tax=Faeces associated gemycircularvirus 18 TaxID=1843738 RepID=A0A160HX62_9VIRU|nr:capsid protein [Faeces associated gemycircularvirus 18]ANC51593.1 capsid protein [Faeces associated gemycircularvirus 18]
MAYARKRRYARRKSGSSKGKRTTRPSARRYRSTGRTRRSTRTRPMSKKSILNTTSRKKRNGMLTFSNSTGTGVLASIGQNPLTIAGSAAGNNLGYVHFRPTAMDLNDNNAAPNSITTMSARTSTTCFLRGLAENIRIETSSGNPWFHRRICFTSRDTLFLSVASADTPGTDRAAAASGAIETSNGWQRLAANMALDTMTGTINNFNGLIFKGTQGRRLGMTSLLHLSILHALTSSMTRPRFTNPGNERGVLRETKIWHPMNKNIVYDDDERGDKYATNNYSVTDKRGMGDYHIIDLFSQGSSGSTSDLLKIRYTSTMYWHEK